MVQSPRGCPAGRFGPVGRRDQVKTARVVQNKTLQQVSIKAVRVLYQLEKVITILRQSQVERGIAEIRVQVDHQGLPAAIAGQRSSQLRNQRSNTAATLCADKSRHLAAVTLFLFSSPSSNPRHRIQQLLGIERF